MFIRTITPTNNAAPNMRPTPIISGRTHFVSAGMAGCGSGSGACVAA
jgi:hypothetical protein